MTFDEYQNNAIKTDLFAGKEGDITSISFIEKLLGLVGESGEIADKFKKIYRDTDGKMNDEQRELMKKEFGDVLWYISTLSSYLGFSLDEVASMNIEKLRDRQERNKLRGSGDAR